MTTSTRLAGSRGRDQGEREPGGHPGTGGRPGPPGLSASSAAGDSPGVVSAGPERPASDSKAAGLVSRCSDQGNSTRNGVTMTMAAFSGSTATSQRRTASAADREDGAEHPGERRERGRRRDQQSGGPGRAAGLAGRGGEHSARADRHQGQQHERDRGAEPSRGDGAGGDRQQRVAGRQQHPRGRGGDQPAAGQVGGQPGERHAAEQQDVHRQPRLPAEHGPQRGHDRQVGRRGRGGPDAHRVEARPGTPATASRRRPRRAPARRRRAGLEPSSRRSAISATSRSPANSCTPGWPMTRRTTDCSSTNCSSSSGSSTAE